MDKEKYYEADRLAHSIEFQKVCLARIECLRKENRLGEDLRIADCKDDFQIPDELETPILDLLTDYHNDILSELEKEFEEL